MNLVNSKVLSLVFQRPGEPVFMPKQDGTIMCLDVPVNFLTPRHQEIVNELREKWFKNVSEIIPINNVAVPDLTDIVKMEKTEMFQVFLEEHQIIAQKLIDIFMKQRMINDLISVATYCHERVNPYLFNYALSVALLHRIDTKQIKLPNFFQCFPSRFLSSSTMIDARQEATVIPKTVRQPVIIPQMFTANMMEPEQKVAYFREDIGINLHHWHWHLVYPQRATETSVVDKDRRGELFFYMHQQIVHRFNIERLSNGMQRVIPMNSIRDVIPEPYFNKLVQGIASRAWPSRFPNVGLRNVLRDSINVTLDDMERWERNINEAINNLSAKHSNGSDVSLADPNGIDILGNMLEASTLSINSDYYGNYHNRGHIMIAYCHDPDGRYLEGVSIMGDTATAMRDPVFYKWHSKINNIFVSLKDLYPPYTKTALTFSNILVTEFKVTVDGKPDNQFNTYWQQSTVDFSRGLDFTPIGPISVQFTHLQHDAFYYSIKVTNSTGRQRIGYARIFMAPKFNENGATMTFNEQKNLMIELDKFPVNLNIGANIIKRRSTDSSVTISFEQTFCTVDTDNFCGCGWPQHMLIPKGNDKGMAFELFILISDYELDRILQDNSGTCNDAASFCGIRDRKFPDKRSMGYPFDRVGGPGITKLADFLTPNMKVSNVVVKFTDKIVVKSSTTRSTLSPAVISPMAR